MRRFSRDTFLEAMITFAHKHVATLSLGLFALSVASVKAQEFPGWEFCAPSVRPSCVDDDATYATQANQKACQSAVDRYAAASLKYRMGLVQRILRATREAESLKELFTCGTERKAACSENQSGRSR